jgi:predicted HTH transcriptional regulator
MTQKEIHIIYKNVISTSFEEQINKDISWDDISKEKIKTFLKKVISLSIKFGHKIYYLVLI